MSSLLSGRRAALASIAILAACAVSGLHAGVLIEDHFDGGALGTDWQVVNPPATSGSGWSIANNTLKVLPATTSGKTFAINNATKTSGSYMASTDFAFSEFSGAANSWFGLVFNYQDAKNYWALRVKAQSTTAQLVQLVYCVNGTESYDALTGDKSLGLALSTGTTYTAAVTVTGNQFQWQIMSGSTTLKSGVVTANDTAPTFTDGKVGYHFNGVGTATSVYTFDNFKTTAGVPEPATLGLMMPAAALLATTRTKK